MVVDWCIDDNVFWIVVCIFIICWCLVVMCIWFVGWNNFVIGVVLVEIKFYYMVGLVVIDIVVCLGVGYFGIIVMVCFYGR